MIHAILDQSLKRAFSVLPVPSSPSNRDRLTTGILYLCAIAAGVIGWNGHVLFLPLAIIFPLLWTIAASRFAAFMVSSGYFLAASRGLPEGAALFFGATVWAGLLLWLIAAFSFVLVHTMLWTRKRGTGRPIRYFVAMVLMAIPPFGITGWANPLTAAGVLFPGWGWTGLFVTMVGLLVMTTRFWPMAALVALLAWGWSAAHWTPPRLPKHWVGIDTQLSGMLGEGNGLSQHQQLARMVQQRVKNGARVVVLPESALGILTPTVKHFWKRRSSDFDVTVLAGAAVFNRTTYDVVIAAVSKDGAHVLYRERMPVPISMWQPWRDWFGSSGGARAHFFANPAIKVDGRRVAPLICYEQLLIWPVLESMLAQPDLIVAIGNDWWAKGTSIPAIQKASAQAWARLFNIPLVTAFNS